MAGQALRRLMAEYKRKFIKIQIHLTEFFNLFDFSSSTMFTFFPFYLQNSHLMLQKESSQDPSLKKTSSSGRLWYPDQWTQFLKADYFLPSSSFQQIIHWIPRRCLSFVRCSIQISSPTVVSASQSFIHPATILWAMSHLLNVGLRCNLSRKFYCQSSQCWPSRTTNHQLTSMRQKCGVKTEKNSIEPLRESWEKRLDCRKLLHTSSLQL